MDIGPKLIGELKKEKWPVVFLTAVSCGVVGVALALPAWINDSRPDWSKVIPCWAAAALAIVLLLARGASRLVEQARIRKALQQLPPVGQVLFGYMLLKGDSHVQCGGAAKCLEELTRQRLLTMAQTDVRSGCSYPEFSVPSTVWRYVEEQKAWMKCGLDVLDHFAPIDGSEQDPEKFRQRLECRARAAKVFDVDVDGLADTLNSQGSAPRKLAECGGASRTKRETRRSAPGPEHARIRRIEGATDDEAR